ncbi:helix-turn-helix domain-containing protein [Spirillospora sp. CA-253888]
MAPKRNKATVSPGLLAFGKRFRSYREAKGWTQQATAKRANNGAGVEYQYIGAIENGRKRCSIEFIEIMDRELEANGELVALWHDLVKDAAFPTWFDWFMVEGEAEELTAYCLALVHGLLQTPEYAARQLRGDKDAVEARMTRQRVWTREEPTPPDGLFLIDEGALLRQVGTHETMAAQLDALCTPPPNVTVQLVPMNGEHHGNISAFTIASLEGRKELVYTENPARGFTLEDSTDLSKMHKTLREIQALALPIDQTIEMIQRIKAERWT